MGIINSLLDTDFYKFTMGQYIFKHHRNTPVKYQFINRSKDVFLTEYIDIDDLRKELDHVRSLRLTLTESRYLRGIDGTTNSIFSRDYIQFLRELELPEYELDYKDGQIRLSFSGPWAKCIYWETFAMSIINQLYFHRLWPRPITYPGQAYRNLGNKLEWIQNNPEVQFADFGTRRRFSYAWHNTVIGGLANLKSNSFLGTSNVHFAMKYNLEPVGTMAHELFMGAAALDSDSDKVFSQKNVLRGWWQEYGYGLSIALTDTYGSKSFFNNFDKSLAQRYKGLRQDSGDPFIFINRAIKHYESLGLNPNDYTIVFSDSLNPVQMQSLNNYCSGRIKCCFGWGTNLTNDCTIAPISIVVKMMECNGKPVVKLSDDPGKESGPPEEIQKYKGIFSTEGVLR